MSLNSNIQYILYTSAKLAILVGILVGCSPLPQQDTLYILNFVDRFNVNSVSMNDARQSEFKICVTGVQRPTEEWAVRAALTWLRALRMVDDQVTDQVAISCQNAHLNINGRSGGGVSLGSSRSVSFNTSNPYAELLHEMGHAVIGLGDTYVNGRAGQCRQGQSQSNMCWGGFGPRANPNQYSGLWQDDIQGAQERYLRIAPDSQAPANASQIDAEAPLDVNNPWPTSGSQGVTPTLDSSSNALAVHLLAGSNIQNGLYHNNLEIGAPSNISQVKICYGDKQSCSQTQASNAAIGSQRTIGAQKVFKTSSSLTVQNGSVITILGYDAANLSTPTVIRTVRFDI